MSKISCKKIIYICCSLLFSLSLAFFFRDYASFNFRYLETLIVIFSIVMGAVFIGLTIVLGSNAPISKKSSYKILKIVELNKTISLLKLSMFTSFALLFLSVFYILFFGKECRNFEMEEWFSHLESFLISTIILLSTLSLCLTFPIANSIFHLIKINNDETIEE